VTQPALGLVASALMMILALGFIRLFDVGTFLGWVAFFMLGLIPMQVVAVVLWGGNPGFVKGLRQPAKGIVLVLVTIVAAVIATAISHAVVGEGVSPPGPIASHFAVVAVPTTFWLSIMLGGWPFTKLMKNPIAAGLAVVVAAYVATYIGFRLFFNYDFLQGAPVYLASAPRGMFNAVTALVFWVTALAAMFLVLCFDLWPLTTSPSIMRQPVLGLVWTAITIAIAAAALWLGLGVFGMDPMAFLVGVTAPFIFGTIIVLNMLQNSLFSTMAQPVKGLANTIAAAAIGVLLAYVYGALSPMVSGVLPSGPPGYDFEVWLAVFRLEATARTECLGANLRSPPQSPKGHWNADKRSDPRKHSTSSGRSNFLPVLDFAQWPSV
jgi:hypothetical protein